MLWLKKCKYLVVSSSQTPTAKHTSNTTLSIDCQPQAMTSDKGNYRSPPTPTANAAPKRILLPPA